MMGIVWVERSMRKDLMSSKPSAPGIIQSIMAGPAYCGEQLEESLPRLKMFRIPFPSPAVLLQQPTDVWLIVNDID